MLNPSIALLISIGAILILLRLRLHPSLAIFVGGLIISALALPLNLIPSLMLETLLDYQTVRLLVVIACALTLSSLMEEKGLLAKLAMVLEGISPKLAMHLVPAVIGLVPMPAGALVSATTLRGLVKRIGLKPEQSTFINYWFRHIWEFSLPIYPSIIITSAIFSIPLFSVVKTLFPMTILVIVFGIFLSYVILRKVSRTQERSFSKKIIAYNFLKAAWPILLLVVLILLKLNVIITFPLILALLAIQQRARWPELKKAFKYGLDIKILFLLYSVMLYKTIIESSDAANAIFSDMQMIGLPALVILAALPFLIGFATGIGIAFAGITLPLLAPFIISDTIFNSYALLLAFFSGMMGVFLSPLHLCLILSAEFFKAHLAKVYRYILPISIAMEAIVILIYFIAT
jgi:integral membrane protein (TIGR00529 family)